MRFKVIKGIKRKYDGRKLRAISKNRVSEVSLIKEKTRLKFHGGLF